MKSIRFFLSIVILSTITLLAFLSALNGYNDSMSKAEEIFDSELSDKAQLLSMAFSLARSKRDKNQTTDRKDDYFAFQIWHNKHVLLHSPNAPEEAIAPFQEGFQESNFLNHRWRTYSHYNENSNLWIMTAERIDIRYILAEKIVLKTILPVVIMLPLLGILIWSIITYGLSPLRILARELGDKRADDLIPLAIENQPVELIQLVNSTNDLLKRLKASFIREKQFASDAAHELRTPISAIKIHLHNLSHLISADEQSFLELRTSVDRMGHLVEQILNLNRTSNEQYMSRLVHFDLYALVQEVIVREYENFEKKNIHIALEGTAISINGDKFALELMVLNLITNAYKYTPENGSVLISILSDEKTKEQAIKKEVFFQIEDSGPGIPESQYERLFDRFYRLDGDCHTSGTTGCGLGLAIVQQIVELHHANISLGPSRFSSGLKVRVTFSIKDL